MLIHGVTMNLKKRKRIRTKGRAVCFIFFLATTIILIAGFLLEALTWVDTSFVTALYAQLFVGICILLMIFFSLLLCIYFERLTLEKKILIMLGFIAISFGIIGIAGLVFQNEISFVDALYKTFQLFVGEFGDISFEVGTFPLYLNIARFLALFVTFGTIVVLLAKEKLIQLSIRFAYKDTVIITDGISQRISAIIGRLHDDNRRLVIGLIDTSLSSVDIVQGENAPVVSFNIDKDLQKGLYACNIKKAGCIFLLCSNTSDNIRIYRDLLPIQKKNYNKQVIDSIKNHDSKTLSPADIYTDFRNALNKPIVSLKSSKKRNKKICYIQYTQTSDKEYYSLDESLAARTDAFETYFINLTDTAIRQMISRISLHNLVTGNSGLSLDNPINRMRELKIGVAGSGELFYSSLKEISQLCIFTDKTPLTIYNLYDKSSSNSTRGITAKGLLKPLLDMVDLPVPPVTAFSSEPDLLFICSEDVIEIRSILHSVFQSGISASIREYVILTECGSVDMDIMKKYIDTLASSCRANIGKHSSPPGGAVIRLGNVIDLIMTIDDFYKAYGPGFRAVHNAYKSAMQNGKLDDFNKLPEIFIESNLLNSIHSSLSLELTVLLNSKDPDIITDEYLEFLAATEHERWFNERSLRGFVYSEETDYMLNLNSYLKHWPRLGTDKQNNNIRYVLEGFKTQLSANRSDYEDFLKTRISEYKLQNTQEDVKYDL